MVIALMALVKSMDAAGKRFEWHFDRTRYPYQRQYSLDRLRQQRQHHQRLHYYGSMAGVGISQEAIRRLEDRVHAQHPGALASSSPSEVNRIRIMAGRREANEHEFTSREIPIQDS